MTVIQCSACNLARDHRLEAIKDHFRALSASAYDRPTNSGREWMFKLNFDDSYSNRTVSTITGTYTRECFLCGYIRIRESWEFVGYASGREMHWFAPNEAPRPERRSITDWIFPSNNSSMQNNNVPVFQIGPVENAQSSMAMPRYSDKRHHHQNHANNVPVFQIGSVADGQTSVAVTGSEYTVSKARTYIDESGSAVRVWKEYTGHPDGRPGTVIESISNNNSSSGWPAGVTPESVWLSNFGRL
ncbi:hypothetical protein BJ742DRAFT_859311 [Cladochytrium replicatum]|nr:hypothetical protein BJ742DRAFT_859311 [Cladochytrium replicatum]